MALKRNHTILLVDDEKSIIKALKRLFRKDGYQILSALNGMEGVEVLKNCIEPVSLIISDQRMPEMTGSEFLEKAKELFPDAIRFLLTGYSDMDAVIQAVNKGKIHRYLTKPWNDDDIRIQVKQGLKQLELVEENRDLQKLTKLQNKELNELNSDLEQKVVERTRAVIQKHKQAQLLNQKLEKSLKETIHLLSSLVDITDPALGRYMRHVSLMAMAIAKEYELDKEERNQVEMAGLIHDIGLIGLPQSILLKDESHMSEDEYHRFSQHPLVASICMENIEQLREVAYIVLHHHEYFNGSGFPDGLSQDKIPIGSQIIGVVGAYYKIIDLWPQEIKGIIKTAHKVFGAEAKNFSIDEPRKMLSELAERYLLMESNKKYNPEIVTHIIKRINQNPKDSKDIIMISLENLEEGMVLAKNLRLKDGRLLLEKGTIIKKRSINPLQDVAKRHLLDNQVAILA